MALGQFLAYSFPGFFIRYPPVARVSESERPASLVSYPYQMEQMSIPTGKPGFCVRFQHVPVPPRRVATDFRHYPTAA